MKRSIRQKGTICLSFLMAFSGVMPAAGLASEEKGTVGGTHVDSLTNDSEVTEAEWDEMDFGSLSYHLGHNGIHKKTSANTYEPDASFSDEQKEDIGYKLPDGFSFVNDFPNGVQLKEVGGYYSDRLASAQFRDGTFNPSSFIEAMEEDRAYKLVHHTKVADTEGRESFLFEERTVTKAELKATDSFTFSGDVIDVMYPDEFYTLYLESNLGRYPGHYHQLLTNVPDFYDIAMHKVDGSEAFLMETVYSEDDQALIPDDNLIEVRFMQDGVPEGVYDIHTNGFSGVTLHGDMLDERIDVLHTNPSEMGIQYSVMTQNDGAAAWKQTFETAYADYDEDTVIDVSGTDAYTLDSINYEERSDDASISFEILGDTGHLLQSVGVFNAGYYGEDAGLDIWEAMGVRDQNWTMMNMNLQIDNEAGETVAFYDGTSTHHRIIEPLEGGTYTAIVSFQTGLDSTVELTESFTVDERLYADLILPDGFEPVHDFGNEAKLTDSDGGTLTYRFGSDASLDLSELVGRMDDEDVYSLVIAARMRESSTGDDYIYTIEETVTRTDLDQIESFSVSGKLHEIVSPDPAHEVTALAQLSHRGTRFEGLSGIYTERPEAFDVLYTDTTGTSLSILEATYQEEERLFEVAEGERSVFKFNQNGEEIGIYGMNHYFEGERIELYAASVENQFTQLITNSEGQHISFKHLSNEGAADPWVYEFGYTYSEPGDMIVHVPDNNQIGSYDVLVDVFESGLGVYMTSNENDAYFLQSGILPRDGEYSKDIYDFFDEYALQRRFAYAKSTVEVFDDAGDLVMDKTTTMPTSYSLPPMDDGQYEIVTTIPVGSDERLVITRDVYIGDPFAAFDNGDSVRLHIDEMITLSYTAGGKDLLFRVVGENGNLLYHDWTDAYNSILSKTEEFTFESPGIYSFQIVHDGEVLDAVEVTVYEGDLHLVYEGDTALTVEYGEAFELPEVKVMYGDEERGQADVTVTDESGEEVPEVDTSAPGEYTLVYRYISEEGEEASSVTITVTVLEDAAPIVPEIHYEGDTELSVEYGEAFELPEVKVMYGDEERGQADVTVTDESGEEVPEVDTSAPGEYTLVYRYISEEGEEASSVTITVTVLEEVKEDEPTFTDLNEGYRFYEEIAFLSGMEVINGYLDGSFAPDDTVTRAAAATMIGRALDLDGSQRDTDFPDVRDGNNASGFIQAAADLGIIQGFPDGTFRPNEPVTRGQMAIFIARAFDMETQAEMDFTDMVPSMAAYESVGMILHEDITQGFPDGTYRPDDAVTRGQFSAFLSRTLDASFR
ncbi:S-layer homology domain-containing protein [Salisediminibacterium selenitireducens]|uniref:S-layer domain protein n=1 Tax=Bacillus selenitireducens (strain ATCC 700615 / DSM 15326 / MLS10) TaxID=439292 RepID=D6XZI1_BACIE|nr:S-layer homology domain-containing protein [Salisediminibacterium selenitireducens]ADH98355.1 S-layer domain protein [[Bacillus] selenitireducens MLS10]